jgi:predicted aspartyl protease
MAAQTRDPRSHWPSSNWIRLGKVEIKVGGQPMIFMVDSGAEHSMVTKPVAPLTQHRTTIVRATGTQTAWQFCPARTCQLGGHEMTHEFLCLPECLIPLLGRDLLTKLRAQITFNQGGPANLTVRGPNAPSSWQ